MRKKLLIVSFCLFWAFLIKAQHCPFDGTSIVLIKVMNDTDNTNFMLKELDNPRADSCTYAKGLLEMKFQPIDSFYADNHWIETYEKRYNMQPIKSKGDLYVKLNQATADCMIKKGNDYTYLKRHFIITFNSKKTGEMELIVVPETKIFKMCTTSGSWDRFEAIKIE